MNTAISTPSTASGASKSNNMYTSSSRRTKLDSFQQQQQQLATPVRPNAVPPTTTPYDYFQQPVPGTTGNVSQVQTPLVVSAEVSSAMAALRQSARPRNPRPKNNMARKFICTHPNCGKRFNRRFTLKEHMKTHTGVKPYKCDYKNCNSRFSTSGNLSRHKLTHSGEKHFVCTVPMCDKRFCTKEKLNRHLKTHLGLRPYMCKVPGCNKRFSTSGNLGRHMKKHNHAERAKIEAQKAADASQQYSVPPTATPTHGSAVTQQMSMGPPARYQYLQPLKIPYSDMIDQYIVNALTGPSPVPDRREKALDVPGKFDGMLSSDLALPMKYDTSDSTSDASQVQTTSTQSLLSVSHGVSRAMTSSNLLTPSPLEPPVPSHEWTNNFTNEYTALAGNLFGPSSLLTPRGCSASLSAPTFLKDEKFNSDCLYHDNSVTQDSEPLPYVEPDPENMDSVLFASLSALNPMSSC